MTRLFFCFCFFLQSADAAKVLPALLNPIEDRLRLVNDDPESIALDNVFAALAIDDQVVRFTSQPSNGGLIMDFALFSDQTPITRANFLNYVMDGDYVNSFIHRSLPNFVIQGGGFVPEGPIPTDAAIANEFGVSNTYGTLSMAKRPDDPDSATSQWFVSIGDNSDNLDNQNGGFTVFGRITQSTLSSAESFGNPAEFPVYDLRGPIENDPFSAVPLNASFNPDEALTASDLILFTSVELVPIDPADAGESTSLSYSVAKNSNPQIVSAQITPGGSLQLDYQGDSAGSSELTIRATDSVGNTVDDSFIVTVGLRTYANWRVVNFTGDDRTDDAISGPTAGANEGGLSNLERYLHGLNLSGIQTSPVEFTNTTLLGEGYPTFTLPIRNDLNDVTIEIEESSDLGATDPWTPTPFEEISRDSNGPVDSLKIRGTAPYVPESHFFRLRFVLIE